MKTYLNPVHNRPSPDPFALKHRGEYWCYVTGFSSDGRCFGVMHSRDLVNWRELGGAMEPLPGGATCYWAPEVTYFNGRFFMYYSVGNEARMQVRVAVADNPAGPFIDSERGLTMEEFAIDAHPFEDEDGTRYLFYATDFLQHTHIGTGTVVDRLLDMFTLEGRPRPVTRAKYDWQVYDPKRIEKGGVRWHTVEGPFVLKRKNRYYQMFSGGNWKNTTYGVSYAVADSLATEAEWEQASDGQQALLILRTLPGKVIGPGHNSAVRGPDNQQLFCVYHRWSESNSDRVLAVDPLDWAGERMIVLGPSTTPQPAPLAPAIVDFFDEDRAGDPGPNWHCDRGRWSARGGAAIQESVDQVAAARCVAEASSFVTEVSLKSLSGPTTLGSFGVCVHDDIAEALRFCLRPAAGVAVISWQGETSWSEQEIALPAEFDSSVYHLLRLEIDGPLVSVELEGIAWRWQDRITVEAKGVSLVTSGMAAAFSGFAFTIGWQDMFTRQERDPARLGWQTAHEGNWHIADQQLWHSNLEAQHASITKGPPLESYEVAVNARLVVAADGCYGFYPAMDRDGKGILFTVERRDARWALLEHRASGERLYQLPAHFDPLVYQQFRFRKERDGLTIQWESEVLGETVVPTGLSSAALYAHKAIAAFDMARVTAIK